MYGADVTFDVDAALASFRAANAPEKPPGRRGRARTPPRHMSREERLAIALAQREQMRALGETPPLPDPCGKDRKDRALRYFAYEDARRRRDAGEATPEELAYLEARFAHLSQWRKAKNARRKRGLEHKGTDDVDAPQRKNKKKKRGASKSTPPTVFADVAVADDEAAAALRPRGPDDLRALFEVRAKR